MKIIGKPTLLKGGDYLALVDYETTSPGYGKDVKDTIVTAEELYKCYLETRNNKCYCGHTDFCDCADLGLTMFKEHLKNGNISFAKDNDWKPIK